MQTDNPEQIVEAHLKAFSGNDLDKIVGDYADDVIFVLPNEVRQGKQAVADFFGPQRSGPNPPRLDYKISPANGRVVVADWTLGAGTPAQMNGRDVFVVTGGKIQMQAVYIGGPPPAKP